MGGHDRQLLSAVAPAFPRGHGPDVLRRFQRRQHTKPLAGQVQPLVAVVPAKGRAGFLDGPQLALGDLPVAGGQERLEYVFLRLFPGPHRVLELLVTAQIPALAFEVDGGPPPLLSRHPLHAGDAAGVVAADWPGADHLHAGPVYIRQIGPGDLTGQLTKVLLVAAAGSLAPTPEALGDDCGFFPAVAAAAPRRPRADVCRGLQDRQPAKPLPGQVQFFSGMSRHTGSAPSCRQNKHFVAKELPRRCLRHPFRQRSAKKQARWRVVKKITAVG